MKQLKLILPALILFIGCSSGVERLDIVEKLQANHPEKFFPNHVYLVLPNAGCSGCIDSVEKFVIEKSRDYNNLTIIFTRFNSEKDIKIRMNYQEDLTQNAIFDHHEVYVKENAEGIYPVFYVIKDGKEKLEGLISPENPNSLYQLQELLNSSI